MDCELRGIPVFNIQNGTYDRGYDCYLADYGCKLWIANGRKIRHEGDWTCEVQSFNNTWFNSTNYVSLEFKNDPQELLSKAIEELMNKFMQGLDEIHNLVRNFE